MNLPKAIAIVGPTASGKTEWALKLAQKYNGTIISADSQQVYKGFDIGTAKVGKLIESKNILEIYRKHNDVAQYLIDIADPGEQFSVADFQKLALTKLEQISAEQKIPFLVGGSGLYVDSVCEGYEFLRESWEIKVTRADLEKLSTKELVELLVKHDPVSAKKIDQKNTRRIIRALEVTLNSGVPYSAQLRTQKPPYEFLKIGIGLPKPILNARISNRINEMIRQGLVREVRALLEKYPPESPAFSSVGYREIIGYIGRKYDIKEAALLLITDTQKLVKKQMTWFRKSPNIVWVEKFEKADQLIDKFLS
jgi:tRNA dimethylallyltransferase